MRTNEGGARAPTFMPQGKPAASSEAEGFNSFITVTFFGTTLGVLRTAPEEGDAGAGAGAGTH